MTSPEVADDSFNKKEAEARINLMTQLSEFSDSKDENDKIEGVFDGDKLDETLKTALMKKPEVIDSTIETIDTLLERELSEDKKEDLNNLRRNLVFLKEDIAEENFKKKYEDVKDITEEEFVDLCNRESLTEEEVKQIVKRAIKQEGGLVVFEEIKSITDTQANYLQDVQSLYIPDSSLTEHQKEILKHRNHF